jgi:hypothetical protein
MRLRTGRLWAVLALLLAWAAKGASSEPPRQFGNAAEAVACRAMEVHTDAVGRMTVVVFHHAEDASRGALAALLRAHSGDAVDVELDSLASGKWRGTVFRLRSCFGRGLLLLPASAPPLKEGAKFRLRLAAP